MIEKITGNVDMLTWNDSIVSLWYNYTSETLITDYDFSENEHNVSHFNMFQFAPHVFGFDQQGFREVMDIISRQEHPDIFYHTMMNKHWVRVGRDTKDYVWYFYYKPWSHESLASVCKLIQSLLFPGVRAYRTDHSYVDVFISHHQTKIRFGWSDQPDTTFGEIGV